MEIEKIEVTPNNSGKVNDEKIPIPKEEVALNSQSGDLKTTNESNNSVISTPAAEEVTKRSIRVETWKKFQEHRCAAFPINIFNRIPNFLGAEKAAALLAETPEFKNAKHIKVNIEKSQDPVKLQAIAAGKILYVPAAKESPALFAKINCPADADATLQKKVIRSQSLKEYATEIDINSDIKLDLLVIGSVAVAKDGYRIGKGNGYVDLDFGILAYSGVVTKNTLIVTTVHDVQVYNTLPVALFKNYDVPVDMIVTPTEVIRVSNRLTRPTTIQWQLLSERRLGIVPVLKVIKEKEEKEGRSIQLKSEDTDVESNRKQQKPRQNRRVVRRRRKPRPSTENGGDNNQENITPRPRRKRPRRFRKSKVDGEQSSNDKENNSTSRKRRDIRDFCIKVSNIAKHIRIKDLKAELRKRGCNPIFISWKGAYGKCYLHFGKHGAGDPEAAINQMLTSLDNLTLTVQRGGATEEVPLRVELIKRSPETNHMESANITSV